MLRRRSSADEAGDQAPAEQQHGEHGRRHDDERERGALTGHPAEQHAEHHGAHHDDRAEGERPRTAVEGEAREQPAGRGTDQERGGGPHDAADVEPLRVRAATHGREQHHQHDVEHRGERAAHDRTRSKRDRWRGGACVGSTPSNRLDTDSPSWMRLIASAKSPATERTLSSGQPAGAGTVSVVTTSLIIGWPRSRSTALPANRPCVQATAASVTPRSASRSSSSTIEPPVAISSSRMMARLPATSPTIESMTTRSSPSRRFEPAATGRPSSRENWVASLALPRSGDTTTEFSRSCSRKWSASTPSAVRWSTGTEKKPCTWGACRFMVSTRSAPAVEIRSATRRPPSEMREASFLSLRA